MNNKITFITLALLSMLLMQLAFVPQQTVSAASCDAAQFVADITIPDGTSFNAGQTFTKTWRLKNVGTCTWSKDYSLVFDSGNQMGAPASVAFPNQSIAPGGTVDLSVGMTAPNTGGTIRGNWKLKNAGNSIFGIGAAADKAFWVEIRVSTSSGGGTGYDFVEKAASATWTSSAGALTFGGSTSDAKGAGLKIDNPKLENGTTSSTPGLLMLPENTYNGFVQAQYPVYRVQSGDRFKSIINCEYNATSCYVNFRLDTLIGSGPVKTFWSFTERYEGLYYPADIDLSSLAGQDVQFILRIGAAGYATGDRALWAGPRIASAGGTSATRTPTVTGTPPTPTATPSGPTKTPTPGTGCSDKATFISDLDVPDGKTFNANTAFTKTWAIKNIGTCTWTTAYKLVFVSGDQMSGPNDQSLGATVGPNTTVNVAVKLTSPSTNGHYRGYWQFKNAAGTLFGIGSTADKPFWVDITVSGGSNITSTPTMTGTPPTPTATPSGPTKTPTPNMSSDRAIFIADITVPDGTVYGPNATFTKTWRLKNSGSSTWTTSYKLFFVSGDQMGGPNEIPLTANVPPNGIVDLSVGLKSPAANGHYQGYWQLKNASGAPFGIGSSANKPFWVEIYVTGGSGNTATPTVASAVTQTATITQTSAPATLTVTPTGTAPAATTTATPTVTPTATQ